MSLSQAVAIQFSYRKSCVVVETAPPLYPIWFSGRKVETMSLMKSYVPLTRFILLEQTCINSKWILYLCWISESSDEFQLSNLSYLWSDLKMAYQAYFYFFFSKKLEKNDNSKTWFKIILLRILLFVSFSNQRKYGLNLNWR